MDEQRKRERFKKSVIAVIAAVVLLLVGLLIQGCKSERSASATALPQLGAAPAVQKPAPASVPAVSAAATVSPAASHAPVTGTVQTIYVVKSGDTLSRIAKAHGISLKALRAANSLDNDRIAVGTKLKIPTA